MSDWLYCFQLVVLLRGLGMVKVWFLNSLEVQLIPVSRVGSQTAIRELWEDTGLKDLQLLGTHQALNNVGGEIHYVV